MTATWSASPRRISWIESDRDRYERDRAEVETDWPALQWTSYGAGGWVGSLPLWPFARSGPAGLDELTGGVELELCVELSQAYPMVQPTLWPISPEPDVTEWTLHKWHVNGNGSLCLLQSVSAWDPKAPLGELLLKAAGWRIEYALMKAGIINTMTTNGIVSDPQLDELIDAAVHGSGGVQ